MGLYSLYQSQIAPPSLRGPNGKIIESTYGGEKDVEMDRARQGVVASLPGVGPADATPYIGSERGLPQAVGESTADWAERLRTVWDGEQGWSFAGGHTGILFALQRAGFPMGTATGVNIVQRYVRYSYLASGVVTFGTHPTWTFGPPPLWPPHLDPTDPKLFSQFGIVFGADPAVPVGTTLQDGDPSADLLNDLVDEWKPSEWSFMGTWVVLSGPTWGWPFTVEWGDSGRAWGGGSTRFISPT
jgi:hypothetical protein